MYWLGNVCRWVEGMGRLCGLVVGLKDCVKDSIRVYCLRVVEVIVFSGFCMDVESFYNV